MFTLEIGGQPTAVMNVAEEDARAILEGEGFREDLQRLTSDSKPLWDGKAPLSLRPATEEEIAELEESEEEDEEDEEEDEDAATILFLVPLDEEEEDEEDDEA